jgi:hypothetical protein
MLRLNQAEMAPGTEPDVWQWAKAHARSIHSRHLNSDLMRCRGRVNAALTLAFRGVSNVPPPPEGKYSAVTMSSTSRSRQQSLRSADGRGEKRMDVSAPLALLYSTRNVLDLRVS